LHKIFHEKQTKIFHANQTLLNKHIWALDNSRGAMFPLENIILCYILNERGVIRPEWRNRPEGMPSGLEIYMGGRKEKIHTSICSSPVLNIYKKYKKKMATRMPWLTCEPMIKNYFSQISRLRPERIVCFFLSSLPLS
jgi:hypothetical protein